MDNLKIYLRRMIENETYGQALLFIGQDSGEMQKNTEEFARGVLQMSQSEVHPDLISIKPQGKLALHSMESIRRLTQEVYLPPTLARKKVFIIHEAERMLPTSANALLKTLEEPAPSALIILLTSKPQKLLPTIVSRCRRIFFPSTIQADTTLNQNTLVQVTLDSLQQGKQSTYEEFGGLLKPILKEVEATKKQIEKEFLHLAKGEEGADRSALQKEAIQKEIDGVVSLRLKDQYDHILQAILVWYRDLTLLENKGNRDQLLLPERKEVLVDMLRAGYLLPLDHVTKLIEEAKTHLERSTPFKTVLEALFLKLNFL